MGVGCTRSPTPPNQSPRRGKPGANRPSTRGVRGPSVTDPQEQASAGLLCCSTLVHCRVHGPQAPWPPEASGSPERSVGWFCLGAACPSGTVGDVWRHFLVVTRKEEEALGISRVEARGAAAAFRARTAPIAAFSHPSVPGAQPEKLRPRRSRVLAGALLTPGCRLPGAPGGPRAPGPPGASRCPRMLAPNDGHRRGQEGAQGLTRLPLLTVTGLLTFRLRPHGVEGISSRKSTCKQR